MFEFPTSISVDGAPGAHRPAAASPSLDPAQSRTQAHSLHKYTPRFNMLQYIDGNTKTTIVQRAAYTGIGANHGTNPEQGHSRGTSR